MTGEALKLPQSPAKTPSTAPGSSQSLDLRQRLAASASLLQVHSPQKSTRVAAAAQHDHRSSPTSRAHAKAPAPEPAKPPAAEQEAQQNPAAHALELLQGGDQTSCDVGESRFDCGSPKSPARVIPRIEVITRSTSLTVEIDSANVQLQRSLTGKLDEITPQSKGAALRESPSSSHDSPARAGASPAPSDLLRQLFKDAASPDKAGSHPDGLLALAEAARKAAGPDAEPPTPATSAQQDGAVSGGTRVTGGRRLIGSMPPHLEHSGLRLRATAVLPVSQAVGFLDRQASAPTPRASDALAAFAVDTLVLPQPHPIDPRSTHRAGLVRQPSDKPLAPTWPGIVIADEPWAGPGDMQDGTGAAAADPDAPIPMLTPLRAKKPQRSSAPPALAPAPAKRAPASSGAAAAAAAAAPAKRPRVAAADDEGLPPFFWPPPGTKPRVAEAEDDMPPFFWPPPKQQGPLAASAKRPQTAVRSADVQAASGPVLVPRAALPGPPRAKEASVPQAVSAGPRPRPAAAMPPAGLPISPRMRAAAPYAPLPRPAAPPRAQPVAIPRPAAPALAAAANMSRLPSDAASGAPPLPRVVIPPDNAPQRFVSDARTGEQDWVLSEQELLQLPVEWLQAAFDELQYRAQQALQGNDPWGLLTLHEQQQQGQGQSQCMALAVVP